jgi:hypothetical protein
MLNPFMLFKIYGQLNTAANKAREMTMQNWKTTVFGALAAVFFALQNYQGANTWLGYAGAIAVVLVGVLAKDFDVKLSPDEIAAVTKMVAGVKVLLLVALLGGLMLSWPARVQAQTAAQVTAALTPPASTGLQNLYAAGASYSVNATPAVAGTALYAHQVNASGTYAFTAIDAVPNTLKPFTVNTNVGAGVAQQVWTIGKIPIFMPTAAGISWNGSNTGWEWGSGALAAIPIKNGYYLMPSVRFLKSSVSNGSGYQPIIGVLFGWGK